MVRKTGGYDGEIPIFSPNNNGFIIGFAGFEHYNHSMNPYNIIMHN